MDPSPFGKMSKSRYLPQIRDEFEQIQIFPFGSSRVSIDDLIDTLQYPRDHRGCCQFELRAPFDVKIGDLRFYGVKQRPETREEILDRLKLGTAMERRHLYDILREEFDGPITLDF